MRTLSETLFESLESHAVSTVFGIPGVHTAELYRALDQFKIRHITPRHEQAAGFMADGYARVSGKPGVCLAITGPGLSNLATPMLQARSDSIAMLVISSVNDFDGECQGKLHAMPNQSAFMRSVALHTFTIDSHENLTRAVDYAFTVFRSSKPGPIHLQLPLSLIQNRSVAEQHPLDLPGLMQPSVTALKPALEQLNKATAPIILAGGGAKRASDEIMLLSQRLDCPIVSTINARALFPHEHPNHVAASASLDSVRKLIQASDTVLAIGTELGATDYDMYETGLAISLDPLIHIDIDPRVVSHATFPLVGDAKTLCKNLLEGTNKKTNSARVEQITNVRASALRGLPAGYQAHISFLEEIRERVPNCVFVGDSTQLIYAGNLAFGPGNRADWFNSSCGFGTLGYGLPAAIGAKLAAPQRPVLAIVGDIGLQFVLAELGTLRDTQQGITVLVWNNQGSGEIRDFMVQQDIKPEGVDLAAPNFSALAEAYSLDFQSSEDFSSLAKLTTQSLVRGESTLIEFKVL